MARAGVRAERARCVESRQAEIARGALAGAWQGRNVPGMTLASNAKDCALLLRLLNSVAAALLLAWWLATHSHTCG